MIAHQPAWSARPPSRTLLIAAMTLISLSGLLTGLALRPLTHSLAQASRPSTAATSAPAATSVPPVTSSVISTPQAFYLGLVVTPQIAQAGDTITVHAQTHLSKGTGSALGISCALTVTGTGSLPTGSAVLTDASGSANWTIQIPPSTPPGIYNVAAQATWGDFQANWQTNLVIQ